MKEVKRGLIKYILFSLITFGIYDLYIIHKAAKEANKADASTKKVGGLIWFIIFTALTAGIYSFYWQYKVTEKFANVIRADGQKPPITGGALLLWMIFGSMIIVGPFIAGHKFFKNWNMAVAIYNRKNA